MSVLSEKKQQELNDKQSNQFINIMINEWNIVYTGTNSNGNEFYIIKINPDFSFLINKKNLHKSSKGNLYINLRKDTKYSLSNVSGEALGYIFSKYNDLEVNLKDKYVLKNNKTLYYDKIEKAEKIEKSKPVQGNNSYN